jgi:hypothetical protein
MRHFRYNATDHPIAFHRGNDLGPIKKIAAKDVPDIEEAFDVSPQLVCPFVHPSKHITGRRHCRGRGRRSSQEIQKVGGRPRCLD